MAVVTLIAAAMAGWIAAGAALALGAGWGAVFAAYGAAALLTATPLVLRGFAPMPRAAAASAASGRP